MTLQVGHEAAHLRRGTLWLKVQKGSPSETVYKKTPRLLSSFLQNDLSPSLNYTKNLGFGKSGFGPLLGIDESNE